MAFYEDYTTYKENHSLIEKFLLSLGLLKFERIIKKFPIDTSGQNEGERIFVRNCSASFEDMHILHISNKSIKHGLYCNHTNEIIDTMKKYEALEDEHTNVLEKSINDNTILLELDENSLKFDNYKKEFTVDVKVNAEIVDHGIIEQFDHYVVFNIVIYNEEFEYYWGNLILQGINLENEEKYDLSYLLFFSAFDNYVTLLTEKLQKLYYKELNLVSLTFEKKVSLLLKHNLNINIATENQKNATESLLMKKYTELYTMRNHVAHGRYRDITQKMSNECLDFFIMYYTVINTKAKTNIELLKKIKEYKRVFVGEVVNEEVIVQPFSISNN